MVFLKYNNGSSTMNFNERFTIHLIFTRHLYYFRLHCLSRSCLTGSASATTFSLKAILCDKRRALYRPQYGGRYRVITMDKLLAEAVRAYPVLYDKASKVFQRPKKEEFGVAGHCSKNQFYLR